MSKSETNEILKSELQNELVWNFAGFDHLDLFRFSNFEFRAFRCSALPLHFVRLRLLKLRPAARRSCPVFHRSIPTTREIACRAVFERRRSPARPTRSAGILRTGRVCYLPPIRDMWAPSRARPA